MSEKVNIPARLVKYGRTRWPGAKAGTSGTRVAVDVPDREAREASAIATTGEPR
jgi:hypothetical protein